MLTSGDLLLFCSIGFTVLLGIPSITAAALDSEKPKISLGSCITRIFDDNIGIFLIFAVIYLACCLEILFDSSDSNIASLRTIIAIVNVFIIFAVAIMTLIALMDSRIIKQVRDQNQLLKGPST